MKANFCQKKKKHSNKFLGFKIPTHKQRQKFVGLEAVSTVDFNAVRSPSLSRKCFR